MEAWSDLDCTEYLHRAICYGIMEFATREFVTGELVLLPDIPKDGDDLKLARTYLEE